MGRVCKNAFISITGIGRFRINRIVKQFLLAGDMPCENRGGNRVREKLTPRSQHETIR